MRVHAWTGWDTEAGDVHTAQGTPPLTEEMVRRRSTHIRIHIDRVGQMFLINFVASLGTRRKFDLLAHSKPWLHFYCAAKRKQTLKREGAWMDNELVWVGGLTDWWGDGWMEKMDGGDGEIDEMTDGWTHGMDEWDGLVDERKGCRTGWVGGWGG